jgi:hypothetical protein
VYRVCDCACMIEGVLNFILGEEGCLKAAFNLHSKCCVCPLCAGVSNSCPAKAQFEIFVRSVYKSEELENIRVPINSIRLISSRFLVPSPTVRNPKL